jgi:ribosome-associated toxin RatA of RatAB toxin-antitoxin module
MYDLVNDVRSYPQYLPLCGGVKILFQSPTALRATLTLAKGKIRFSFTTANTMVEGKSIQMNLVDGPFKHFRGAWQFEPSARGGCEASFRCDFEFSNTLLGLAFGGFFKEVMESLVDAFCRQAAIRYVKPRVGGTSSVPVVPSAGSAP